MFLDFLISLSFYLIPASIGLFVSRNLISSWLFGSLAIYGIFFLISTFTNSINSPLLFQKLTTMILLILSIGGLFFFFLRKLFRKEKIFTFPAFDFLSIAILALFSFVIFFFIWKKDSPYPLQLNWDIYEHITVANKISKGYINIFPSQISDTFTFNGYTTLFHTILSIPRIFFNRNLIGIYFWLDFWHYLLTIVAISYFVYKFLKNKSIALVTGILSGLLFESSVVYSNLFLIPQTLVGLMTILILTKIQGKNLINISLKEHAPLIISLFILFLFHFVIGLLAVGTLVVFIFLERLNQSGKKITRYVTFALLVLISAFVFNFFGLWTITGREEASFFNLPLAKKFNLFLDWYGVGLIVLLILGFWSSIKSQDNSPKIVAALSLLTTSAAILPISYSLKFFVIGRYFIIFVASMGLFYLINYLGRISKFIVYFWVILIFGIVFQLNISVYKDSHRAEEYQTQISFSEIEAGNWLAKNYGNKTFLISDPSTQYILEGVSGINTQGGAYVDLQTREILSSANDSTADKTKEAISGIKDKLEFENSKDRKVLFVIGGRYFAWQRLPEDQKMSFYYNIWKPYNISPNYFKDIEKLKIHPDFKLKFQNNELIIFEVNSI